MAALAPTVAAASTIDATTRIAAGQTAISAPVAALTAGVTNAMLFTTLRAPAAVVLALGLAAAGATTLTGRAATRQDDEIPAAAKATDPPPAKQKKDEDVVAWGRRIGGLQAGLVLCGAKMVYRHGDTVTLGVRVRNAGKAAVTFGYVPQHLDENPPTVTDGDGATTLQPRILSLGVAHPAVPVTLEPGKEIDLKSHLYGTAGRQYVLTPEGGRREGETRGRPLFVVTGAVTVELERVFGDSSIGKAEIPPALRRLGTGVLELDIETAKACKR